MSAVDVVEQPLSGPIFDRESFDEDRYVSKAEVKWSKDAIQSLSSAPEARRLSQPA